MNQILGSEDMVREREQIPYIEHIRSPSKSGEQNIK